MTRWVVAGSGPSLTESVCSALRGQNVIAVNDAYKLLPFAQALYAADLDWWRHNDGAMDFAGEKWSVWTIKDEWASRRHAAKRWGLKLVQGSKGAGFSKDPSRIVYGLHSGYQATGIAVHKGATLIVLVGFDMRGTHFFGPHQAPLRQRPSYGNWIAKWAEAMKMLPPGLKIINATPNSALHCVPFVELSEALRG